jgi:hypothetical protein
VIREMENAATAAMKLPWSRIRALALSETAGLYLDLSKGVRDLPPPKGLSPDDQQAYEQTISKLVIPFEEKGQEMRAKAFEIASKFAIEDESFSAVADPYFADNPSTASKLKPKKDPARPLGIDLQVLAKLDPKGDWDDLDPRSKEPLDFLKASWADALQKKRWGQVAFFLQEASEKKLFTPTVLGAIRAVSLAQAGARGEALSELEETRKGLDVPAQKHAVLVLISHYLRAYSKERTKALVEEAFKLDPEIELAIRGPKPGSKDEKEGRKPASISPKDLVGSTLKFANDWLVGG